MALRLGELLDLTWGDVQLAESGGVITVRAETATDADVRLIPISSKLAGFLEMAKTDPVGKDYAADTFVFGELGEQLGSIKKAWDLRRECGSRWHEGGFQLHEVRGLLGHANVSQTDTYLSARIAGLRESMKRFDALRGKTVAKDPSIGQRPLGHTENEDRTKDQLH